jgi:predicted DNA-binding protein (MmcQ/YjbR family)
MDIEVIQEICLGLKGVTQDIKWVNNLCFCVGGKIFCMASLDEIPTRASFKVPEAEFEELILREGIIQAPYMARNKWVLAEDITRLSKKEWTHYLKNSYDLIAAKLPVKIKKEIGL